MPSGPADGTIASVTERDPESFPGPTKVIGRRRPPTGGLSAAAPLLELVVELRGKRPFLPKGVYRFNSFEESQEWSLKMMTRSSSHAPRR